MGHLAVTRVNDYPSDSTDIAVSGMHRPAGVHSHISQRNGVVNEGLTDAVPVWSRRRLRLLGRIELFELRLRAAETNLARRDIDKVDRHKSAESLPVLWFDHKMSDPSEAVNDHTAHLATDPIDAAGIDPDRESHQLCHSHSPRLLRSYGPHECPPRFAPSRQFGQRRRYMVQHRDRRTSPSDVAVSEPAPERPPRLHAALEQASPAPELPPRRYGGAPMKPRIWEGVRSSLIDPNMSRLLEAVGKSDSEGWPMAEFRLPGLTGLPQHQIAELLDAARTHGFVLHVGNPPNAKRGSPLVRTTPGWYLSDAGREAIGR